MAVVGKKTFEAYDLEYRSKGDDAWYSVRAILDSEEKSLVLKFEGFIEACDLKFRAEEFENEAAVDDFVKRFRPTSIQLQDSECRLLVKGKEVCAALSVGPDNLQFYDAVVDEVRHQGHGLRDGEDECHCIFIRCWLHGPLSGRLNIVNLSNICIIQDAASSDHRIVSFATFAKQNMQILRSKSCSESVSKVGGPSRQKEVIYLSSSASKSQDDDAESFCRNGSKDEDVDEDIGGYDCAESGSLYYILIDNLENDLSTSSIGRFICEKTSISPQAYLFPCQMSAPSTSGAIASTFKESIDKIYEFLIDPNHLIVSARGRPWVIRREVLSGAFQATLGCLLDDSQIMKRSFPLKDEITKDKLIRDLQVVPSGTGAYKTAKQLRDLYIEFVNHGKRLYKRLALEESKILESCSTEETSPVHKHANACKGC